jgi:hypothetical protein
MPEADCFWEIAVSPVLLIAAWVATSTFPMAVNDHHADADQTHKSGLR